MGEASAAAARGGVLRLSPALLPAAVAAAGLWVSLTYAFAGFKFDPDMAVTVELWRGMAQHGLGFLKTWSYTADNWILSVQPIASALYALFGPQPAMVLLLGWASFLASTALTAAIAAKLAGRGPAAILGCALLFANPYAVGAIGFLAYPISHDVSMAWGLLALLLAVIALERPAYAPALAAGGAVLAAAVSDPWASAAAGGPMVATGAALAWLRRGERSGKVALALSLASAAALIVAHLHPFGLFRFLPRGGFAPGGIAAMAANLRYGTHALAVMFDVVPGASPDAPVIEAISLGALATLMGGAGVLVALDLPRAPPARQFAAGVAILSVGAVTTLYVTGQAATGLYVGRFFANLYFLGALLAALAAGRGGRWRRVAALAYAVAFVLSGLALGPRLWTAPPQAATQADAVALGSFLEANGHSYGYGPYWGASALAVQTLTDGAVTIRPVTFQGGRFARRPAETSRLWFAPGAEPAGARPFLVIRPDGEECPDPAVCEAAAMRQFGPPAERLLHGDAVVLAWDRPLVDRIVP